MSLEQPAKLATTDAQPFGQRLDAGFVGIERPLGDQVQRAVHGARGAAPDGRSGAISGRQRRQGRKPASCAAAADAKKRQFSNFGGRAGQTGRQ